MNKILLVTVTKVEAQAVLNLYSQSTGKKWERLAIQTRTYYMLGTLSGCDLYMVQSEMGNIGPGAALMTIHQAIEDLEPDAVIMIGIAFGAKPEKQKIGDILISKQIQVYEPQKVESNGPIPRGDRVTASTSLLSKFRSGDLDWQGSQVHFGLILSGEKLVNDQKYLNELLLHEPEAIGGEMEGAGLYTAANDKSIDWILVKAICDWADGKKNDEHHRTAAENATAFTIHVIKQCGLHRYPLPPLRITQDEFENVVLLVGAGVSKYLGLSTLDELMNKTILGEDDVAKRIKITRNAIEAQKGQSKAVYEELISRLRYYQEVSMLLRRDHTFRNEFIDEFGNMPISGDNMIFESRWSSALTRCYRILLKEYGPDNIIINTPEYNSVIDMLSELAKINSGRLHVYTTNYDCSLQVVASNCSNLTFYTHIDNRNDRNGSFTNYWFQANPYQEMIGQPKIFVHRFHGCVGWFSDPAIKHYGVREVYGSGGDLKIIDDELLHRMAIKLTSSQPIGANPAFSLAFEEFADHLRATRILLVWGYSFRDIEILRYINQALSPENATIFIYYIDPYLDEQTMRGYIHSTMNEAPIHVYKNFEPKRIDWRPSDGPQQLITKVLEVVTRKLLKMIQINPTET